MKLLRLYLSVVLLLCSSMVLAQQPIPEGPLLFRVYDGTTDGHKFNQDQDGYFRGKRLPIGAETPEGADLKELRHIDVYVVSRSFADTLLVWQRTNRVDHLAQEDDSVMLSQFYDYYNAYNYKLTRRSDGTYDLKQAFEKAKQIYNKFTDIWNYWGDLPTDFELIIHHSGSAPAGSNVQNGAERHRIRDIIRYYTDGSDDEVCPIFYDGKVTGVETKYEVATKPTYVKRVISLGKTLEFEENIAIAGEKEERVTVERFIESCSFQEDFDALVNRQHRRMNPDQINAFKQSLERVMKSVSADFYTRENWPAFVVPGEKFEQAMLRRMSYSLPNDTLYKMRIRTEKFFGYNIDSLSKRLYLSRDSLKLHQTVTYEMPDVNRYYHMKHTTYIQDFAHVEGIDREECPCYRTNDLRFLNLASQYATLDCPPTLPGNNIRESYQPVSPAKEIHSVQKEVYLAFEKAKWNVNDKLGRNRKELDSLISIAHQIVAFEETNNKIDTVKVVAISSPEGSSWNFNKDLSHRRANQVSRWVKEHCEGALAAKAVAVDSVATWLDVADIVEKFGSSYKTLAEDIRAAVGNDNPRNTSAHQKLIAYQTGSNPIIDRALQQLRKVQVNFVYKAQTDPSHESALLQYRHGSDRNLFTAYYYWVLLNSNSISQEEKLKLAREVIDKPMLPGDEFLRTRYPENEQVQPEQWFDLIRPLAANILAVESIKKREYDVNILAPYITPEARINTTVYDFAENRPYKYINADFLIYNQLAMLLSKGDEESLNQADIYLQMFQNARVSDEFRDKYRPQDLIDLVMCYTSPSLAHDTDLAERIKKTGIVNYYVIQMSQIHQTYLYDLGQVYSAEIKEQIKNCYDRLPELKAREDFAREKAYFEAVTEGRYADFIGADEERAGATLEEAQSVKDKHIDAAIDALVRLFIEDPDMVSFCQGDYYVRGIYRNPLLKSQGIDYFLEAIEKYVNYLDKQLNDE